MKRKMDLIRAILLDVKKRQPACGIWEAEPFFEGKDSATVVEHLNLLINEGYLTGDANYIPESGFWEVSGINLTWQAHEFLSLSRNDCIWKTAKEKILGAGIAFSVPLLMELLTNLAKAKLDL